MASLEEQSYLIAVGISIFQLGAGDFQVQEQCTLSNIERAGQYRAGQPRSTWSVPRDEDTPIRRIAEGRHSRKWASTDNHATHSQAPGSARSDVVQSRERSWAPDMRHPRWLAARRTEGYWQCRILAATKWVDMRLLLRSWMGPDWLLHGVRRLPTCWRDPEEYQQRAGESRLRFL